jgi:heat-inducible transcriptional repressor
MHELTQRQGEILSKTIADYIRVGEAVSSDDIRKRHRLVYSPATIRNELRELTSLGYLTQPHTSAGRIPTDLGYRWYVKKLEKSYASERPEHEISRLAGSVDDPNDFFRQSTETLAPLVQALVIGGTLEDKDESFYMNGFRELLATPEFTERELRDAFGELMDSLDSLLRKVLRAREFSRPHVFIGSENPIPEARHCSMIVQTLDLGGARGVIAILGSKRMRYDRGLKFLTEINNLINHV